MNEFFKKERSKSDKFQEELYNMSVENIKALDTIIVWIFQSKRDPDIKQYFIKNNLHESNYREKIGGKLLTDFNFFEEIDTGTKLERKNDGSLEFDSLMKLRETDEFYKQKYNKFI